MKKFIFLLPFLFFSLFAFGQNEGINYQAVLRDSDGTCLSNRALSIVFKIKDGNTTIYEEVNGVRTGEDGHFQTVIGKGSPIGGGNFDDIDWRKNNYTLEVDFDDSSFPDEPNLPFLRTPYAYNAEVAANGKLKEASGDDIFFIRTADGGNKVTSTIRNNAGRMTFSGDNGNVNVEIWSDETGDANGNPEDRHSHGRISIKNDEGQDMVRLKSENTPGVGQVFIFGENGKLNVSLANTATNRPDFGSVGLHDEGGSRVGRFYIKPDGRSTIEVDDKAFVMDYPNKEGKEIVYISLEGPEAGAYDRGTATLVNGEAYIEFSETFSVVANPETLTIITSPWSAKSKGLAIVERTEKGFKVKELRRGKGTYKFDWEVKGVRKGYEDFKPVRDKELQNH